jgi:hypothetical protein
MIPEKDRDRMIFIDAGYDDEGIEPKMDWPEKAGPRAEYM